MNKFGKTLNIANIEEYQMNHTASFRSNIFNRTSFNRTKLNAVTGISILSKIGTLFVFVAILLFACAYSIEYPLSGSFGYDPIVAISGNPASASPRWINAWSGQAVQYSMVPTAGGTLPAGIAIDPATGDISVGADVDIQSATFYTVTATGIRGAQGSLETTVSIVVATTYIDNFELAYGDIQATRDQESESRPQWPAGTEVQNIVDYKLARTDGGDVPLGISIDNKTGVITVRSNINLPSAEYIVTATGTYDGLSTATFRITVGNQLAVNFSYTENINTVFGTKKTSGWPDWTNAPPGQTVAYSMEPKGGGTLPGGISIDAYSGRVSVSNLADVHHAEYTVTATGTGDYVGEVVSSISITVKPKEIAETFSYAENINTVFGTEKTSGLPYWTNALPGQTVTYSMEPKGGGTLPGGISIDADSGRVSVSNLADVHHAEYTVTATGTGSYSGFGYSSISININNYGFQPAYVGQPYSLSLANALPSVTYSVSPALPDGLNLDTSTGRIYGTPTTRQFAKEYSITATPTSGGTSATETVVLIVMETAKDKYDLWRIIDEEIKAQGITADLNLIDTSKITDMRYLFNSNTYLFSHADYSAFNGDISGWDVSGVTDMSEMFRDADAFNGDISGWDVSGVNSMSGMFEDADAFNGNISGWDVSSVKDMSEMFWGARAFNRDLSGWDVSAVTDMRSMFSGAGAFNGNISGWDVSAVKDMRWMFDEADAFSREISGWDVSGVKDMSSMFSEARAFNGDISEWDVSGVKNMNGMFMDADAFNGDISNWNVSGVESMRSMFYSADAFNGDISGWDVSGVTDMSWMFGGAAAFNGDISEWDVSSVKSMYKMFEATRAFNRDLSGWDVSGVKDMSSMFSSASAFNGDLSGWDVSGVINMSEMFSGASAFNRDLSGWDVSGVKDMSQMFRDATAFNRNLSGWDVSAVPSMSRMFYGAVAFNGDISEWDVSGVTDMSEMFYFAINFNGDLSGWDVSSVKTMSRMFHSAGAFNRDLSGWDVSGVTNMRYMFAFAYAFNRDLSGWDISGVEDMSKMFYGADAFNGDLSGWDVSGVKSMYRMFSDARAFNRDLSGWDVSGVTDMSHMFYNANAFNRDISGWDVSGVTDMSHMFESAYAFNRDLSGWDVSGVTEMSKMFKDAYAFNGDLEPWGAHLSGRSVSMDSMFDSSGLANNRPSWYTE